MAQLTQATKGAQPPANELFTGVVWESRTTKQLATDLSTGYGPEPLERLARDHTVYAHILNKIIDDFAPLIRRLPEVMDTAGTSELVSRLVKLEAWAIEMTRLHDKSAALSHHVSAAYSTAVLNMPSIEDAELLERSRAELSIIDNALIGSLTGASTAADADAHHTQLRAARVMESYERASSSASAPMHSIMPPIVANDAALKAEENKRKQGNTKPTGSANNRASGLASGGGGANTAPLGAMPTKMAAPQLRSADFTPKPGTPQSGKPVSNGRMAMPMAPLAAAGHAAAANQGAAASKRGMQDDHGTDAQLRGDAQLDSEVFGETHNSAPAVLGDDVGGVL